MKKPAIRSEDCPCFMILIMPSNINLVIKSSSYRKYILQFINKNLSNIRECSLIMAWGVGKLEGGTELFGVLGWGEPIFFRSADWGGGTDFFGPLIILIFTHNFYLFRVRPFKINFMV